MSTSKAIAAITLVVFVLWLALIAGFFFSNVGTPASDGWNWAVALSTAMGAIIFLILGLFGIFKPE